MKKCYFLIGLPGVGKSTITEKILEEEKNAVYLSTDAFLDDIAKEKGIDYNKAWKDYGKDAEKRFTALLRSSMNKGTTLVWDQTNVVKSSRIKKLKSLKEKGYIVIGLNFEIPDEEWQKRLQKRESEGGKKVPRFVLSNMQKTYQRADYTEGFEEIFLINEKSELSLLPNDLINKVKLT